MLMLTSDQWIKHIRERNALIRSAQSRPGGRGSGYGVVPREREGVEYVWDESGNLQAVRVPAMRAHPFYPLDPEALRSREAVEIRRPTSEQWSQAWSRVFDPSRRQELESSPYLPQELMGSPSPEMQWWAEPWKGVASPEEGEPRRMIHPSVVDPSRMPSMDVHGRAPWKDPTHATANMALIEMMELMRGIATEASNIEEDPSSLDRIQEMGETYEELRKSIIYPLKQMADGMLRSLAGKTGRPVEELMSLIDPWPVIVHAMVKLFGTYYNAQTRIKSKREGEPARLADPLTYLTKVVAADINGLVQEHLERVKQTSSSDQMMQDQGDAAEALLMDQQEMVRAFREAPTEEAAIELTSQVREQTVNDVKRAMPGLTDRLNQGFAAFLATGAASLVSPMMTEGMLKNLFNPDGTPVFDVGAKKPVPDSWCPNCGKTWDFGPNGDKQPAIVKEGETFYCQFCESILMDKGRPADIIPGAGGGAEGGRFEPTRYETSDPQRKMIESSINVPLLAYLEMERQNPKKWTDAERRGIYHLMIGLPIVRVQRGQPLSPTKSHGRRFSAVTMPQGGKVVAVPTVLREKLSPQVLQSMQEQQMSMGGAGIGELVRGRDWAGTTGGYNFELGRFPAPEEAEFGPLGFISNPADIGRIMATQMAGEVAPQELGTTVLPGEELQSGSLPQMSDDRGTKYSNELRSQVQGYTSTLVTHAMYYLGPTIPTALGRVDPETNQPIPFTSEQIVSDLEPMLRNGAYQIAQAYGYDEEKVYDDLAEMVSYVDQISQTPGSSIRPEWLSDRMVSYIFSNFGGPIGKPYAQMVQTLVDQFLPEGTPPEQVKAEKKKLEAEAKSAVIKANTIAEQGQRIEETAGKIRERQFDLGWQIVDAADGLRASRGQQDLATLLAENIRGIGRPFGYTERTVTPFVQRQLGTVDESGNVVQQNAEAEKLRQELAVSVVGMFGFGDDYNGYQGAVSGGVLDSNNRGFSVQMPVELPDGGYQMFVGDVAIPVAKSGDVWKVVDTKKLPKGFSVGPGSPVTIDESIVERIGMPGGGGKLVYRTSSDFSPQAIAQKWNLTPDQVKSLQASTLRQGVDAMFSKPTYDPTAVTKNVMAGLMPPVIARLFMQEANRKIIEVKGKEMRHITPEDRMFQDPIGRAATFILDVGNAMQSGLGERGMAEIKQKYPEVSDAYISMVMKEMASGSGPSYRTYLIASHYADRLRPLAEPFELTAKMRSSSMSRFAMFGGMMR